MKLMNIIWPAYKKKATTTYTGTVWRLSIHERVTWWCVDVRHPQTEKTLHIFFSYCIFFAISISYTFSSVVWEMFHVVYLCVRKSLAQPCPLITFNVIDSIRMTI